MLINALCTTALQYSPVHHVCAEALHVKTSCQAYGFEFEQGCMAEQLPHDPAVELHSCKQNVRTCSPGHVRSCTISVSAGVAAAAAQHEGLSEGLSCSLVPVGTISPEISVEALKWVDTAGS